VARRNILRIPANSSAGYTWQSMLKTFNWFVNPARYTQNAAMKKSRPEAAPETAVCQS
jgi:hypothetical protein